MEKWFGQLGSNKRPHKNSSEGKRNTQEMGACRESIKGLTGGATGRDWNGAATAPAAPKGAASTNSGIWEARGGRKTKQKTQIPSD